MNITSKKLSILGMVLAGASVVTAAVLPSNDKADGRQANGRIVFSDNGSDDANRTCVVDSAAVCTDTAAGFGQSGTTGLTPDTNNNLTANGTTI